MKICPLLPHLASQHATIASNIEISLRHSGWGNGALLEWKHGVHVLGWLPNLEKWVIMAQHDSTVLSHAARLENAAACYMAQLPLVCLFPLSLWVA
jgi:hypothetical protein